VAIRNRRNRLSSTIRLRLIKVILCVRGVFAPLSAGSTLRVSIGSPYGNTPVAGSSVSTLAATATGGGVLDPDAGIWVQGTTKSASWAQVANNATVKNGPYIFAVSHSTAGANNYLVKLHCENVAVGALPLPDSSVGIHTGTGVGAGNIDEPNGVVTTTADYNQFINQ